MSAYVSPRHLLKELEGLKSMIQFYSDRPVSRKEAANQLGISLRTLDRKIKEGYIAVRIAADGTRFIFQSDLNRYASGLPMEAKNVG